MSGLNEQIGRTVRKIRQANGWRQEDVAERSGGRFKASHLGLLERGERTWNAETIQAVAEALGVPAATLLEDDEGKPAPMALSEMERLLTMAWRHRGASGVREVADDLSAIDFLWTGPQDRDAGLGPVLRTVLDKILGTVQFFHLTAAGMAAEKGRAERDVQRARYAEMWPESAAYYMEDDAFARAREDTIAAHVEAAAEVVQGFTGMIERARTAPAGSLQERAKFRDQLLYDLQQSLERAYRSVTDPEPKP